jgi:hypothetical protein
LGPYAVAGGHGHHPGWRAGLVLAARQHFHSAAVIERIGATSETPPSAL